MVTINIGVASLTSIGIIAMIFSDQIWLKLISALISFATVHITAYFKSFDLEKFIVSHKTTANKLISVKDLRYCWQKLRLQSDSVENLLISSKELAEKTDAIYLEAPTTADKAVNRASEALEIKKDKTCTDDEIYSFLPSSLRRENK